MIKYTTNQRGEADQDQILILPKIGIVNEGGEKTTRKNIGDMIVTKRESIIIEGDGEVVRLRTDVNTAIIDFSENSVFDLID